MRDNKLMGSCGLLLLIVLMLAAVACEEDELMTHEEGGATDPAATSKKKVDAAPDAGLPPMQFTEADFVESEEARDPFRDYSYLYTKTAKTPRDDQKRVKAAAFALDELRLVGVITRSTRRAMLTDPSGFGWVVYPGDFVGKAERVSTGGIDADDVPLNWRVDRIRPANVVFIREDAAHPEIAPTTRVIPLYPIGDEGS